MEGVKESNITGYPKIIRYDSIRNIVQQMERGICKIKIGIEQGTGFFCKIPFPNKENMLPVFITNNHIINKELFNEKIQIKIKEEKNKKYINLNKNRKKYTNEKYDITIIEIIEEDNINNYLELDDKILNDIVNNENENENEEYIDETIYIIQYPEGELSVSFGILNGIAKDKCYTLLHKSYTNEGSSGSPILNLQNKIIGIHKEGDKKNLILVNMKFCLPVFLFSCIN